MSAYSDYEGSDREGSNRGSFDHRGASDRGSRHEGSNNEGSNHDSFSRTGSSQGSSSYESSSQEIIVETLYAEPRDSPLSAGKVVEEEHRVRSSSPDDFWPADDSRGESSLRAGFERESRPYVRSSAPTGDAQRRTSSDSNGENWDSDTPYAYPGGGGKLPASGATDPVPPHLERRDEEARSNLKHASRRYRAPGYTSRPRIAAKPPSTSVYKQPYAYSDDDLYVEHRGSDGEWYEDDDYLDNNAQGQRSRERPIRIRSRFSPHLDSDGSIRPAERRVEFENPRAASSDPEIDYIPQRRRGFFSSNPFRRSSPPPRTVIRRGSVQSFSSVDSRRRPARRVNTTPSIYIYSPAESADKKARIQNLVETFTFHDKGERDANSERQPQTGRSMLRAWHQKQAKFPNGIRTELTVINAAESFKGEGNKGVVTLYCQKDALDNNAGSQRQIHWLHVQHTSDVIDAVKSLITCCPLISRGYQSLALGLVDSVSAPDATVSRSINRKWGRRVVARSDREPGGRPELRDTVVFASTPYLALREKQPGRRSTDSMQSVLTYRYGSDLAASRSAVQVLSETQKWLKKETVHVARMGSLLIGPEVMLTWGEMPLSVICKDNIVIDDSELRPLITVKLFADGKEYHSYVKHDTSLAELNALVASLTSAEEFEIRNGTSKISSEIWAEVLWGAFVNFTDIRLKVKTLSPTKKASSTVHKRWGSADSRTRPLLDYDGRRSRSRSRTRRLPPPPPTAADRKAIKKAARLGKAVGEFYRAHRSRSRHRDTGASLPAYDSGPLVRRQRTMSRERTMSSTRSGSPPNGDYDKQLVRYGEFVETARYAESQKRTDYARDPQKTSHDEMKDMDDRWVQNARAYIGAAKRADMAHLSASDGKGKASDKSGRSASPEMYYRHPNIRSAWPLEESEVFYRKDSSRAEPFIKPTRDFDARENRGAPKHRSSKHEAFKKRTSETKLPVQDAMKSAESNLTPFLMWRVTKSDDGDAGDEDSFGTMVRLFRRVDTVLTRSKRYGKIYVAGFQCSMQDMLSRNITPIPPDAKASVSPTSTARQPDGPTDASAETEKPEEQEYDPVSGATPGQLYVTTIEEANNMVKDILAQSSLILGFFVPLGEVALESDVEVVLKRWWGALDMMFRHLQYAARASAAEGSQRWKIKGSCKDPGDKSLNHCQACVDGKDYSLVDALKHFHAGDASCGADDILVRPHEDPCIVWLQNTEVPERDDMFNSLIIELEAFQSQLKRIADLCRELHLFISRPQIGEGTPDAGGGKQDRPNDGAAKQENGGVSGFEDEEHSKGTSEKPALPVSLLRAFESIMAMFAIQARVVVLTGRTSDSNADRQVWRRRARQAKEECVDTWSKALKHLERSREDLILNIVAEDDKTVRLGAVGPEYILSMALTNLHQGLFRVGHGSSSVPQSLAGSLDEQGRLATRRGVVMWTNDEPDGKGKGSKGQDEEFISSVTVVDLLTLYAEHARALEFSASEDPQRRVFLAIRALEDELDTIDSIFYMQWLTLENLYRVIEPSSFRVPDRERWLRFTVEKEMLTDHEGEKVAEGDELKSMLDWAADLRERVIESIEVLDESHNKAIRVFTLVTLFFLPLSFVTSFFGMNTSDVRDMSAGSGLYWAIAAPVTLSVLGMAYLYGYKWDALTRRVTLRAWREQEMPREAKLVGGGREGLVGRLVHRYRGGRTMESERYLDDKTWSRTREEA